MGLPYPSLSLSSCTQEVFVRRSYLQHGLVAEDGAVVIDAGANIGVFSLHCLREAKGVQVGELGVSYGEAHVCSSATAVRRN